MARRLVKLPYKQDFILRQDEDFTFIYRMRDADDVVIDNTGYEIEMEIRATAGSDIVARYTTGTGEIALGGATGLVTISVPVETIMLYAPGTYGYDIRETNTLLKSRYLFAGLAHIKRMITRAIIEP